MLTRLKIWIVNLFKKLFKSRSLDSDEENTDTDEQDETLDYVTGLYLSVTEEGRLDFSFLIKEEYIDVFAHLFVAINTGKLSDELLKEMHSIFTNANKEELGVKVLEKINDIVTIEANKNIDSIVQVINKNKLNDYNTCDDEEPIIGPLNVFNAQTIEIKESKNGNN